jgi:hypothetical protein
MDDLCQAHRALGHFSSPPGSAWIDAGILLRRSRSTFGQVAFASHFRDLLIASEASRTRATLVTENSPRLRALEVASCVSQEDAETMQPVLTRRSPGLSLGPLLDPRNSHAPWQLEL